MRLLLTFLEHLVLRLLLFLLVLLHRLFLLLLRLPRLAALRVCRILRERERRNGAAETQSGNQEYSGHFLHSMDSRFVLALILADRA